jgi:hypothetical protein
MFLTGANAQWGKLCSNFFAICWRFAFLGYATRGFPRHWWAYYLLLKFENARVAAS